MRSWLAALFAGLVFGLTPLHGMYVPLLIPGLAALGLAVEGRPGWDLARGAAFGALWYGLSLLWFPTIWSEFDPSGLGWLGWLGLVCLQLTVPALGLGLAGLLRRTETPPVLALAFALATTDGLAGWLQPLPGGIAVYMAPIQPLLWPAAFGGTPLFLAVAGAWAALQTTRPLWGLGALVAWFGIGALPMPWATDGDVATIAMIQPGTGAFEGRMASTVDARAAKVRTLVVDGSEADLTVTPEGAWPHDAGPAGSGRRARLLARLGQRPVLLGVSIHDVEGAPPTNSVLAIDRGQVVGRYDKVDLVPFGERSVLGFGRDTFRAGRSRETLHVGGLRVAVRVCYEDLVPGALRGLGDAELVVAATNDVWLGPHQGSRQHEAGTRLAAVLTGRWVVRPAANGRSAIFDPTGRRHLAMRWVDGDAEPGHPGQRATMQVRRRVPMWTGADAGPLVWLLFVLLAAGWLTYGLASAWPSRPG